MRLNLLKMCIYCKKCLLNIHETHVGLGWLYIKVKTYLRILDISMIQLSTEVDWVFTHMASMR